MNRVVVWYSDGAASACAAKLAVEKYGERCEVVKCDTTADEHSDNARFRRDVEAWIGREVKLIRSEKYADLDDVFDNRTYMSGNNGAVCTTELKKFPRLAYQRDDDIHVFGYTANERARIAMFEENNPELVCEWILRDAGLSKTKCLLMVNDAGIALPRMYLLGFDHNNCLGCVKASSPAYWNRTRQLFPLVYEKRSRRSREIGARLVRVKGERIFLDELDPNVGLDESDGDIECGPFCHMDVQDELDLGAA